MNEPTARVVAYDLKGAAEATGLCEKTLRLAVKRGDLIANYLGSKPLFRPVELDRWIESLPTEATKRVAS